MYLLPAKSDLRLPSLVCDWLDFRWLEKVESCEESSTAISVSPSSLLNLRALWTNSEVSRPSRVIQLLSSSLVTRWSTYLALMYSRSFCDPLSYVKPNCDKLTICFSAISSERSVCPVGWIFSLSMYHPTLSMWNLPADPNFIVKGWLVSSVTSNLIIILSFESDLWNNIFSPSASF
jgi:hypothetical protein